MHQAAVVERRVDLAAAAHQHASVIVVGRDLLPLPLARNHLGVRVRLFVVKVYLGGERLVMPRRERADEAPAAFVMTRDAFARDQPLDMGQRSAASSTMAASNSFAQPCRRNLCPCWSRRTLRRHCGSRRRSRNRWLPAPPRWRRRGPARSRNSARSTRRPQSPRRLAPAARGAEVLPIGIASHQYGLALNSGWKIAPSIGPVPGKPRLRRNSAPVNEPLAPRPEDRRADPDVVAPKRIAVSKSSLMPMESFAARCARRSWPAARSAAPGARPPAGCTSGP